MKATQRPNSKERPRSITKKREQTPRRVEANKHWSTSLPIHRKQTTPETPPLQHTENEAGAYEEKSTNECEPKLRGNPVAELPRKEKRHRREKEKEPTQEQEARTRKGSEERKHRESGAEGRKTKIAKAPSGGRRGGGG